MTVNVNRARDSVGASHRTRCLISDEGSCLTDSPLPGQRLRWEITSLNDRANHVRADQTGLVVVNDVSDLQDPLRGVEKGGHAGDNLKIRI